MPLKTSQTKLRHSWQFEAIGTRWSIDSIDSFSGTVKEDINDYIEAFDKAYSRFRSDSIVGTMAHSQGTYMLPRGGKKLGELYQKLYVATNGAMSPLVGSSLNAAGYDKEYSFAVASPKPAPTWNDVMQWQGDTIKITVPIDLDVGAAGKGLLVDGIANKLIQAGINAFTIDASGDVLAKGNVQRIGLENPYDSTTVIGAVEIKNESLCASATNRRKWGNGWHHVLNAKSGRPVDNVVATWVIAESTMLADGLSTALFFVSADKLQHIAPFDYVRVLSDGTIEHSRRFVGQLFI